MPDVLDFTELPKDGTKFEQLVREILQALGTRVYWSGKGPDGGRDLLCYEDRESLFAADTRVWLVQCKHNAHSGCSVGVSELENIIDSCAQHEAHGYLLVCSTQPSSAVIDRLEALTRNNRLPTAYWDQVKLERLLMSQGLWRLAQQFLPCSAHSAGWQIFGTENPSKWVIVYHGFYFYLQNRIGSTVDHHLALLAQRIRRIESIQLPRDHYLRIRELYYNDKGSEYFWYLDYLCPNSAQGPVLSRKALLDLLEDKDEDHEGVHRFSVNLRPYRASDHFDPDHALYYRPYTTELSSLWDGQMTWTWDSGSDIYRVSQFDECDISDDDPNQYESDEHLNEFDELANGQDDHLEFDEQQHVTRELDGPPGGPFGLNCPGCGYFNYFPEHLSTSVICDKCRRLLRLK